MPWWGKSTKKGKRKERKSCVGNMSHGKLRIVSAEKGGRPGTSRRHYLDIVSENVDHSGVYNRHPSHFLRVSSSRSFSEKSSAQPVQLQGGQSSATQLVRSKIDISMRSQFARGSAGLQCWAHCMNLGTQLIHKMVNTLLWNSRLLLFWKAIKLLERLPQIVHPV
ncbi:hypothetical protein Leryth_008923 [Lithospermum erythrorhizon]|nr:hypothetical protein Leryth_008923 [Lithospermum erythrorhizon]